MIDFHTHPILVKELVGSDEALLKAVRDVFKMGSSLQPLETFLLQMDAAGIEKAVLLPIDCSTTKGCRILSNEDIVKLCKENERFIGFASVDPHKENAPQELDYAIKELGLKGLKLDPGLQEFYPNDKKLAYPIYEVASQLKIPVIIHTGLSWESNTMIKYSMPLLVEDVAHDFPKLNIVIAHFGWPWVLDSVALTLKYPNVFIDTAAHYLDTPKEFLEFVLTKQIPITVVERSLRTKILFGSNYPRIEIRKMVDAVKAIGLTEGCLNLIFKENAQRLLNIQQ